jgi:thiosulfate/3-mercaptopyruvate sulfurtransferase
LIAGALLLTGAIAVQPSAQTPPPQTPPAAPATAPPTAPPFKGKINLDLLATRFDVHDAIGDANTVILDVRRESEYRGVEKRARRVGAIPGAVHVFWREHLDARGMYRPAEEIRRLYETKGVTPDKSVIPLCQGGYRSASTFIALRSLGYPRVKNYVSSWGEWGNREDSKIVVPGA